MNGGIHKDRTPSKQSLLRSPCPLSSDHVVPVIELKRGTEISRHFNPRPAGGGAGSAPPPVFSRITPKLLQISTQNLVYLILHRFDIESPNLVEIGRIFFFEKLTFLWGHCTPILTKIGSMLRNSPKIVF